MNPYKKCPKFDSCSVNNCPLHIRYPDIYTDEEDKEKICTLSKEIRSKISSEYSGVLKYQGLTIEECSK